MVEVYDEYGRQLLRRLLAGNPEWAECLTPGEFSADTCNIVHPRLQIPSGHPTIKTPLSVELGGTFRIFWHGGYFYDFLGAGEKQVSEAHEFIQRFFSEEVLCCTGWAAGRAICGGPVESDEPAEWDGKWERLEVRSWRGSRDRDIVR